jgi:signal transduction histidine kinase
MASSRIPENEQLRLKELYEYHILDTESDEDFNEIVQIASSICSTPISLVSLIDTDRQWFKAKVGLDTEETGRNVSFCSHAILGSELFIIPDASRDERFHDNPLVTGRPDIRFYAGVPLVSPSGNNMGSLCVIDTVPRQLTEQQQEVLRVLGKQVVKLMELHKKNIELIITSDQERKQRKELQRISAIQNRILSILAHDMRGPLGAMRTLFEMEMPLEKFRDMALSQVNVSLGLLDNVVEWGQLQVAGSPEKRNEYVLNELVQEILDGCAVSASFKQVALINDIEDSLKVSADQHALKFMLRNLLTNAIKFTKEGSVTLSADISGNQLKMAVKDTGIGMESGLAAQLFQGQRKVSRKGTDNETGSGLGLSLIKEFIDKNKGSIGVKSEPGKGTTITFHWNL